ncbi:ANTAR domain-containing protein [Streptomyces sp. NPDC001443]
MVVQPAGPSPGATTLTVRPVADDLGILCLSGELDSLAADALSHDLAAYLQCSGRTGQRLVLDLSGLRSISAAAVRVLVLATRRLADAPVLVVATAPHVRELFLLSPTPGLLVYPTLSAVLAALPGTAFTPGGQLPQGAAETGQGLQTEVFGLRAKLRTGPTIGVAQGILLERYGLADPASAFDLLREASQRHNVPLRVLASALAAAPPPGHGAEWFPGRLHTPPPPVGLLTGPDLRPDHRHRILDALVHDVMALTDAHAVEVHLTEPGTEDALVLDGHIGLGSAYRDHVARVTGPPALCQRAWTRKEPVYVAEVASDPALAETEEGRLAYAAGTRALYAVPALTDSGVCTGVITVHWSRPGSRMTAGQFTALETLASDLADWRSWYRRTVVLDALEHLHAQGCAAAGSAGSGSDRARVNGDPV